MRRNRRFEDEPTTTKSLIIAGLIFLITFSTSITLTSYPQHLAINENTVIQAIKFVGNDTAIIKGNQVQLGTGDVIPLAGRDYIRITGNQVQVGKTNFTEGIRTVSASWHQNVMFSQKIGSFKSTQTVQIIVDNSVFNLIPLQSEVLSITVVDLSNKANQQHYNTKFNQDTLYINENDIMIRLVRTDDTITASLIGLKKYSNIAMRLI